MGLRPLSFISGNICYEFSVYCICSALPDPSKNGIENLPWAKTTGYAVHFQNTQKMVEKTFHGLKQLDFERNCNVNCLPFKKNLLSDAITLLNGAIFSHVAAVGT